MLDTLLSRASTGELTTPGPNPTEITQMLEAAVRAPDHGKLRPWRFIVIQGDARERLADLFVEAFTRREPAALPAQIEKERAKPLRSPLTVALIISVTEGHKIPVVEQVLSAGAAALNILNAAHALGYGAKWVTGANCYDPWFLQRFGVKGADQLAGFIHIGTPRTPPQTDRPDPAEFTSEWTGPETIPTGQ
jgi:nitroreductase